MNQDLFGWTGAEIKLSRLLFGPSGPQTEVLASGTITSLAAVPEPSTAVLLAGGIALTAFARRSRQPIS